MEFKPPNNPDTFIGKEVGQVHREMLENYKALIQWAENEIKTLVEEYNEIKGTQES